LASAKVDEWKRVGECKVTGGKVDEGKRVTAVTGTATMSSPRHNVATETKAVAG
jgi:hypothetical protein